MYHAPDPPEVLEAPADFQWSDPVKGDVVVEDEPAPPASIRDDSGKLS